jgi:Tfp pilus assembly protein PilO
MTIEINSLILAVLALAAGLYLGYINGWNACIDELRQEEDEEE